MVDWRVVSVERQRTAHDVTAMTKEKVVLFIVAERSDCPLTVGRFFREVCMAVPITGSTHTYTGAFIHSQNDVPAVVLLQTKVPGTKPIV